MTEKKWFFPAVLLLIVVLLGALVGVSIYAAQKGQDEKYQGFEVERLSTNAYLVYTNKDAPVVTVYEDPMCPYCREFERQYGDDLTELAKEGKISIKYMMVNFLDSNSDTGDYSSRIIGALQAAAGKDGETFLKFHEWVYENQPMEGTSLTNEEILDGLSQAGLQDTIAYTDERWKESLTADVDETFKSMREARGDLGVPTVVFKGELVNTDDPQWLETIKKSL